MQFGRYWQDAEGTTLSPIEWTALDNQNGKTLLITTKTIDSNPFHNTLATVTWDNCDLRTWLNGEFFRTAFSREEQKAIALTDVSTLKNPRFDTPVGQPTVTKCFS